MTWVDLAGHASFILSAISFTLRDILLLRALAVVSGLVGIVYNYKVPGGPLWLVLFWLSVFLVINLVQIAWLRLEQRKIALSDAEITLLETTFRGFTPLELSRLMAIAAWRDAPVGHRFAEQGATLDQLQLLFTGEVVVQRDGEEIDRGCDGMLIGEMAFLNAVPASATVIATSPCRYVSWPHDRLRRLLNTQPTLQGRMQQAFTADLIHKLANRPTGTA